VVFLMGGKLSWERDGRDWPNREASRFVAAGGLRWHVQQLGRGPLLLLLHGTGAATHSWAGLAPRLARHFTVVAPDLPGHGFSETPAFHRLSLPEMANGIARLLQVLGAGLPALAVGHSAGAAILIRMALDRRINPAAIISLNGALLPFHGLAGRIFPPMAKLLFLNPFVPQLFAWEAGDRRKVRQLLASTGSSLDDSGVEFYTRLFRSPGHVAGALGMMANWDLDRFSRDLPRLENPLYLVTGTDDGTVPPESATTVAKRVPSARVINLPDLGHLAHEEAPDQVAGLIFDLARRHGVIEA